MTEHYTTCPICKEMRDARNQCINEKCSAYVGKETPITFCGGEVQRLQVQREDKFVLMFKEKLPREAVERIRDMWWKFIGDPEVNILILDGGAQLGVFNIDHAKEKIDDKA